MTEQLHSVVELVSASAEETQGIGRALGERAQPGDLFLLVGGLGAGKTTLTQGIAWGLGVREHARSPTFVLMAQYQGRLPIYHIDLYRVDSVEEALDLGLDDYLWGDGVSVVEWADRAAEAFPGDHMTVHLELIGEESRRLRLEARGTRYEELLADAAGTLAPADGTGPGRPPEEQA
jgi:tRNA threonylcarbamoyladenosine biosynthesis protein TsaE